MCPCCSNKPYLDCCGRFISGSAVPATPSELMRSRYTAYTQANIEYIMQTMKSPAADNFDAESARQWAQEAQWLGLEIVAEKTGADKNRGFVEFIAKFTYHGAHEIIHERSEFHCINQRWYYITGQSRPAVKANRNGPCPCGSGKKYKKCCGA